ncbi:hypothetical protein J6590_003546 [Homalodisca vitripennis]|nr:hypothetical protein J6590_003546 [Homalodisca vitripennis]
MGVARSGSILAIRLPSPFVTKTGTDCSTIRVSPWTVDPAKGRELCLNIVRVIRWKGGEPPRLSVFPSEQNLITTVEKGETRVEM